jgi:hypothetical protein
MIMALRMCCMDNKSGLLFASAGRLLREEEDGERKGKGGEERERERN